MIKSLLGLGPSTDWKQMVADGAVIVDVRTVDEYKSGHIPGSINMPLHTLSGNTGKLKKTDVIITCCASGVRSASAKALLKGKGYQQVHNGGGWWGLQGKLQ